MRRLSPLIAILLVWAGYAVWTVFTQRHHQAIEHHTALVTAQVWIATARYRNDPEEFVYYRDSLLKANGVSRDDLFEYLEQFNNRQEESLEFARSIQRLVDSLYSIEIERLTDSARQVEDSIGASDSATAANAGRDSS